MHLPGWTQRLRRPGNTSRRPRSGDLKSRSVSGGQRAARMVEPASSSLGRPLPPGSGAGARIRTNPSMRDGDDGATVIVRPRPPLVTIGLTLLVLVLAAGLGAYGVVASGVFRVDHVEVEGEQLVSPDTVIAAAGALGRDLFRVNALDVQQRVLQVPGVRAVAVQRTWPRGIKVQIEERTPIAVWRLGGVSYVVDKDGVVLDTAPVSGAPVIYQVDAARSLTPGDRVDRDAVALAVSVTDLARLVAGQEVNRFEWTSQWGLEAVTASTVRVRFGDSTNLEFKLAVWRDIADQTRQAKLAVSLIDLGAGNKVYFR